MCHYAAVKKRPAATTTTSSTDARAKRQQPAPVAPQVNGPRVAAAASNAVVSQQPPSALHQFTQALLKLHLEVAPLRKPMTADDLPPLRLHDCLMSLLHPPDRHKAVQKNVLVSPCQVQGLNALQAVLHWALKTGHVIPEKTLLKTTNGLLHFLAKEIDDGRSATDEQEPYNDIAVKNNSAATTSCFEAWRKGVGGGGHRRTQVEVIRGQCSNCFRALAHLNPSSLAANRKFINVWLLASLKRSHSQHEVHKNAWIILDATLPAAHPKDVGALQGVLEDSFARECTWLGPQLTAKSLATFQNLPFYYSPTPLRNRKEALLQASAAMERACSILPFTLRIQMRLLSRSASQDDAVAGHLGDCLLSLLVPMWHHAQVYCELLTECTLAGSSPVTWLHDVALNPCFGLPDAGFFETILRLLLKSTATRYFDGDGGVQDLLWNAMFSAMLALGRLYCPLLSAASDAVQRMAVILDYHPMTPLQTAPTPQNTASSMRVHLKMMAQKQEQSNLVDSVGSHPLWIFYLLTCLLAPSSNAPYFSTQPKALAGLQRAERILEELADAFHFPNPNSTQTNQSTASLLESSGKSTRIAQMRHNLGEMLEWAMETISSSASDLFKE